MIMTIKKGDKVAVISGPDKGKQGAVLRVLPGKNRVVVEGVNVRKRHFKPRKAQPKGGIVEMAMSIHRSNVMRIDPATEKPVRSSKPREESSKAQK